VLATQGVAAPDAASDGDEPSGAAALAAAALDLWTLGGGERLRTAAERIVADHAAAALAQPLAHGAVLRVAAALAVAPRQLVVVAAHAPSPLATAARGIRSDVVAVVTPAQVRAFTAAGFSLFEGKAMRGTEPTAYDCRDFACRLPVTDPSDLAV
jgi:uncharacterized protein YyaL (SSP411 family)